ncbi:MAG: 50S ribosomal protein L17 [Spirochaetae bacterium HGW-Spirochaetae-6]|nr:MAG: 50S ribosomal protein L17 [Spirochaetae bacterium HGW-Spirochaetae-6]
MRHNIKKKKLGRVSEHRKALLMNLANSLVKHERIITTTAKAKFLRPFFEKLITKAKAGDLHRRRLVFGFLGDKQNTDKLFEDLALRYKTRNGGYTRIYKMYNRKGDDAEMSMIELVEEKLEASDNKKEEKAAAVKKPKKVTEPKAVTPAKQKKETAETEEN